MAYDEKLAQRVRSVLDGRRDVSERKMFGGLAFLLRGRMFCGVIGRELVVRVGKDQYDEVLRARHVRPMDFTGRPMKGYVYVGASGLRSAPALAGWVERGIGIAAELPSPWSGLRPH
jgi:TfoX/Sxy family transcriptional regulator of competence genes